MTYAPKLWTADELAEHHFSYRYLFDPIIPQGGIVLCHGKRGIGKTHFGLTLAGCLNHGGLLFGQYQANRGGVVYIQADMPHQIQQDRVRLARDAVPLTDLWFYFPTHLNLLDLVPSSPLVPAVMAHEPKLIIWDTLRKVFRGSTNDDDMPSQVYGHAQLLFPGVTHLFLHHDKKTVADQALLDQEELFRGSGAWIDDADTGLHLVQNHEKSGKLTLRFTKIRTAGEQDDIGLTLHDSTLLLYAGGEGPRMVHAWRARHPHGTIAELEHWLKVSFGCAPSVITKLIAEESNRCQQRSLPSLTAPTASSGLEDSSPASPSQATGR